MDGWMRVWMDILQLAFWHALTCKFIFHWWHGSWKIIKQQREAMKIINTVRISWELGVFPMNELPVYGGLHWKIAIFRGVVLLKWKSYFCINYIHCSLWTETSGCSPTSDGAVTIMMYGGGLQRLDTFHSSCTTSADEHLSEAIERVASSKWFPIHFLVMEDRLKRTFSIFIAVAFTELISF